MAGEYLAKSYVEEHEERRENRANGLQNGGLWWATTRSATFIDSFT